MALQVWGRRTLLVWLDKPTEALGVAMERVESWK